jgi:hypothetical protein
MHLNDCQINYPNLGYITLHAYELRLFNKETSGGV